MARVRVGASAPPLSLPIPARQVGPAPGQLERNLKAIPGTHHDLDATGLPSPENSTRIWSQVQFADLIPAGGLGSPAKIRRVRAAAAELTVLSARAGPGSRVFSTESSESESESESCAEHFISTHGSNAWGWTCLVQTHHSACVPLQMDSCEIFTQRSSPL